MSLGPETVDRMSLWQFLAYQGGMERVAGGSSDPGLSDEEFKALAEVVGE